MGLYEPLIEGQTPAERKAGLAAGVARFWSMLEDPPTRMPAIMPMTPAIAPKFSERHPRAAAIFDNLHMMHDIISDILSADAVPHRRKREAIYRQLDELRDSTRNVMSLDEWRGMAEMMGGVAVMGGPATGLLANPPTPVAPGMNRMEHEGEKPPAPAPGDSTPPHHEHSSILHPHGGGPTTPGVANRTQTPS